ncbi:type I-B CRISPR-associated protein Cas8b1/Cst1 [Hydrogenivirga sp. 128-5-R1-1]|uniref:type I-B CRISPR-associated protein Cas8b1/Cst1 n=1 Tax=Hydrogenivirga sp. 128-5-R1-1 TaxID=392423 RepID=UPI00015F0CBD|nr:type I-B CRISPR-associated protein Cas8b1/Cst1 [Hydrogenivirga sp. 128-5-R1-1]EDP75971.1 hypothetical protein HG1285_06580 [Hydrogenivirga sp. 128-5-R1-1]
MGVRFYADSWLTASAGVGLLRALENTGYRWEDFVKGNTIELDEEVFEKLPEIYSQYLLRDLSLERFREILEKRKEKFNLYNTVVYEKINDFFSNSPLTNPSGTKKVGEAFNVLLEQEEDIQQLFSEGKKLIAEFVREKFSEILNYQKSKKVCYFCKERHAYIKKGKVKVLDATNFTPLAASLDTVENFFWEGKSNMYLCPECEIFLYFSAFGFHRTPARTYLFVYLPDLENTKRMNDLLRAETDLRSFMNRTIVEASKILAGRKADWILRNIYIVEIEKVGDAQSNIYTLSITPRLASAIKENIDKYPQVFNNLFEVFLEYVYSGRSLYDFIYKILSGFFYKQRYKRLSGRNAQLIKSGMGFKSYLPFGLTYFIKFQEVLEMEDRERVSKQVNWAYSEGLTLKNTYEQSMGKEKANRKIEGISYRLLDAIRRRDTDAFQQNLIRAYLEAEREIPYVFVEALKDGSFNRIAYAFLIGLNGKGKEEVE